MADGRGKNAPVGIASSANGEEILMLWTIAVILLVLWALGLVSGYTMGGVIHILIVIAIVAVLFRLISGRRIA
jgi:hypothetical protein